MLWADGPQYNVVSPSYDNRSYLKERRPQSRKIKKGFLDYKYNWIGRAPYLLATLQPLLIVLHKNHWSPFIHVDNINPHACAARARAIRVPQLICAGVAANLSAWLIY